MKHNCHRHACLFPGNEYVIVCRFDVMHDNVITNHRTNWSKMYNNLGYPEHGFESNNGDSVPGVTGKETSPKSERKSI